MRRMMFQLVLSDKLRSHLADVAKSDAAGSQPVVYDAKTNRMAKMPGYTKNASADNIHIFHGREVRQVPSAAGGFGFGLEWRRNRSQLPTTPCRFGASLTTA